MKIIVIIKINFIKICSKNMPLRSNKCEFIKILIIIGYMGMLSLVCKALSNVSNHFTCNKPITNNF